MSNNITETPEEWSLSKYLSDWPPEGTDADNATTVGLIFLIIVGVFFCCCLSADLQFCCHGIKQLKKKVGQQNRSKSKAFRKTGKVRPSKNDIGRSKMPDKMEGRIAYDKVKSGECMKSLIDSENQNTGSKELLINFENPHLENYGEAPPPYYSSRHSLTLKK